MLKAYDSFENRVEHLKAHTLSKPDRIQSMIDQKVSQEWIYRKGRFGTCYRLCQNLSHEIICLRHYHLK